MALDTSCVHCVRCTVCLQLMLTLLMETCLMRLIASTRTHACWQMLSVILRTGVQGADSGDIAGDPARQPCEHGAAAQGMALICVVICGYRQQVAITRSPHAVSSPCLLRRACMPL